MRAPLLALCLVTVALIGCLGDAEDPTDRGAALTERPYYDAANGHYHFRFAAPAGGAGHLDVAPASVSFLENTGEGPLTVVLPDTALVIKDARFGLPEEVTLAPGERVDFLAPPTAAKLTLVVDGETMVFDTALARDHEPSWNQVVSGERWYEGMLDQQANFPHRTPGEENYDLAIEDFAATFEALGYEVEADPFGTRDLTDLGTPCPAGPTRGATCPETFANVVAFKRGTSLPDEIIFVSGGHFDMVVSTTHAALDNTAGTIGTIELARALAPYEFDRTLAFGLWGGEESGILGSQFWLQTHPVERANIVSYWNLDVIGATWPAPLEEPDPLLITAGPDVPAEPRESGATADPVSQSLLGWAQRLQRDWFGFPDEHFLYEGVAAGQTAGGSNAQSDHTPFLAAGIASFHSGRASISPLRIHHDADTLTNLTKYARFGVHFAPDDPAWPSAAFEQEGREALERSIEANLLFPFYHAVLVDLGVYEVPGRDSAPT